MPTYTVTSNVGTIANQMGVISQRINTLLQDLDDGSKQHLNEWSSDARSAYDTAKAQWDAACAKMSVQANRASASLTEIHDNYANAEFQGLGLWGN